MAQWAGRRHRYTYEEYLAYERDSSLKHEFVDGEILDYQLVPSLHEYVLVSRDEPRIECYRRLPSGAWEYTDVTSGKVPLATGAVLDLGSLYDGLPP